MTEFRNTMKMAMFLSMLVGALPAHAGNMSDKDRQRLENQVRVNASINRDRAESLRQYDRAYKAAKGIDKTIKYATSRSGTGAAYKAGKAVGKAGMKIYQKRKGK